MILNWKNLPGLVVELLVVILGVAIALAADSWREDWVESREEQRYLQRLARDLNEGIDILNREREIFSRVRNSALILSETIESGERLDDDDFVIEHYVQAGQHGVDRWEMYHNTTYQEMIASGRLGLIEDSNIREGLISYYREVDRLIEMLHNLPRMNRSFIEAVGLFPAEFGEYGAALTPVQREKLLMNVREDPEILGLLRRLHANLVFSDRIFAEIIPLAENLVSAVEATID
ncbi:MAG: hypothetical protein R3192_00605 [Woeseiaceae bacterium]|nr:hypothetical protein [Woeseiaceae bacterium]